VVKEDQVKVIYYEKQGAMQSCRVNEILVGVGRKPNIEGLGLEAAGVAYDPGGKGVSVNDYLQTTNHNIYAAGDICMPYKFTHAADAAARIVVQNALFYGRKRLSALTIPWCTYTEPEIAHVGIYERDAINRGIEINTFMRHFRDVDRAIIDGQDEGFVKIHTKAGTDKIAGATIVASHAGDMISEITLSMVGNIGLELISTVIHPYPTQADAIRQAGDLYNRTRLTPLIKKIIERWFSWTR
jgi:pyruvate/2-oxoglutarate dehydrogenase complex dihydrolipoamide dehydrogenase (E3) component